MTAKNISIIFILSIFVFSLQFNISAADIEKDIEVLVLTKSNGKVKYIKSGKRVVIWTSKGEKVKGKIEDITNNNLIVNGKEYDLSEIEAIRVNYLAAKISGAVIGTGGLFVTTLGTVILISAINAKSLGAAFAVLIAIPITAIGLIITTTGVLFLTAGKKHKSYKKWRFSTAQIAQ